MMNLIIDQIVLLIIIFKHLEKEMIFKNYWRAATLIITKIKISIIVKILCLQKII